jgi:hypothetical protein
MPYGDDDRREFPLTTPIVRVNRIFRGHGHQFIWDFETLRDALLGGHTGLPGSSRLVRKLAPTYDNNRFFRSNFFGLTYAGDLCEFIDWEIFFLGAYARAELKFLDQCAGILTARLGELNFADMWNEGDGIG